MRRTVDLSTAAALANPGPGDHRGHNVARGCMSDSARNNQALAEFGFGFGPGVRCPPMYIEATLPIVRN
jgi:hypothetical protein